MVWKTIALLSFLFIHQASGMKVSDDESNFLKEYFKQVHELLSAAEKVIQEKPEYLQKMNFEDSCLYVDESGNASLLCPACSFGIHQFFDSFATMTLEFHDDCSIPEICVSCAGRFKKIREHYASVVSRSVTVYQPKFFSSVQWLRCIISKNKQSCFRCICVIPSLIFLILYFSRYVDRKNYFERKPFLRADRTGTDFSALKSCLQLLRALIKF